MGKNHKRSKASELEHLQNSRRLVDKAIREINQSGSAKYLSRELGDLYHIEDVLWQFVTAMKGE